MIDFHWEASLALFYIGLKDLAIVDRTVVFHTPVSAKTLTAQCYKKPEAPNFCKSIHCFKLYYGMYHCFHPWTIKFL